MSTGLRARSALAAAFAAALALLLSALPAAAEDSILESDLFFADRANLARLLAEGQAALSAGQPELAVDRATVVLETATASESGELASLAAEALLLRARARLARREAGAATADLEDALRLDPSLTSPKGERSPFATALNQTRKRMVGRLEVISTPPGAEVALEGRRLGRTPLAATAVLLGTRYLRVSRPGFATVDRAVTVSAGAAARVHVELERRSATLLVLVDAEPAEIRLNAQLVGTATRPSPAAAEQLIEDHNLPIDPEAPPSLLLVPEAPAGVHAIEIAAPCRRTLRAEVEVPAGGDATAMFRLERLEGSLRVEGARDLELSVSGVASGRPPQLLTGLCPGPHEIVARNPAGRTTRLTARVHADRETRVELGFRPIVGLLREDAALEAAVEALDAFDLLLVHRVLGSDPRTLLDDHGAPRAPALALLADATGAGLFLWREIGQSGSQLALLVPGSPVVERLPVTDEGALGALLRSLESELRLLVPDLGLTTVETRLAPRPLVASLAQGGAAEAAGLRVGDEIIAVGSHEIGSLAELDAALQGLGAGTPVAVRILRSGSESSVAAAPRLSPLDPDYRTGSPPASAVVARLGFQLAARELEGLEEGVARLALAKAWIALGAWPQALAALQEARLPEQDGVGAGTLLYYRGLAAERNGDGDEARRALERALSHPQARLLGPDGPAAMPLVRALLARLQADAAD